MALFGLFGVRDLIGRPQQEKQNNTLELESLRERVIYREGRANQLKRIIRDLYDDTRFSDGYLDAKELTQRIEQAYNEAGNPRCRNLQKLTINSLLMLP